MKRLILIPIVLFLWVSGKAQVSVKDSSIFTPLIMSSYAMQMPGGDLADRFGWNSNVSLGLLFKMKNNLIFGGDASFFFGDKLKEKGILDSISTNDGFIISQEGIYADVNMYERGFTGFLTIGRLFNVFSPNPNSGIFFTLSGGFMQHKIRIEEVGNKSPQISKEYKKGYDRLTSGLAAKEFIGYVYLGNNRMLNFFGGIECIQGFTRSSRSWDFDLMRKDTKKRIDLQFGVRIGWILPLYKKSSVQFYEY